MRLFRIPSLEIVYESAEGPWAWGAINPVTNLAVIPIFGEDSLLVPDFPSNEVAVRKVAIRLLSGTPMRGSGLAFSPDGTKLILDGSPPNVFWERYTQIRGAATLELLHEFFLTLSVPVHTPIRMVYEFSTAIRGLTSTPIQALSGS